MQQHCVDNQTIVVMLLGQLAMIHILVAQQLRLLFMLGIGTTWEYHAVQHNTVYNRASNNPSRRLHEVLQSQRSPWLNKPISAFTFNTILKRYDAKPR